MRSRSISFHRRPKRQTRKRFRVQELSYYCPVCMEDIPLENVAVTRGECGHARHRDPDDDTLTEPRFTDIICQTCFDDNRASGRHTCPICRADMSDRAINALEMLAEVVVNQMNGLPRYATDPDSLPVVDDARVSEILRTALETGHWPEGIGNVQSLMLDTHGWGNILLELSAGARDWTERDVGEDLRRLIELTDSNGQPQHLQIDTLTASPSDDFDPDTLLSRTRDLFPEHEGYIADIIQRDLQVILLQEIVEDIRDGGGLDDLYDVLLPVSQAVHRDNFMDSIGRVINEMISRLPEDEQDSFDQEFGEDTTGGWDQLEHASNILTELNGSPPPVTEEGVRHLLADWGIQM